MRLANLQTELAEQLLNAHTQQLDMTDQALVVPSENLLLYQNNILSTLRHTLENAYPLVMQLTGSDFFRQAAHDYVFSYPSRQSDLQSYGEYFSDFLAEYVPCQHLLYLPEIAQFEWLCHTASIAAEHPPLDIKNLAYIAPEHYEQLYFLLNPACVVKQFYYPVLKIIDLCQKENQSLLDLDNEKGIYLLIMRKNLQVTFTPLGIGEYQCLFSLQAGNSLKDALADATQVDPSFNLEEKLPNWIQQKILVDCYLL